MLHQYLSLLLQLLYHLYRLADLNLNQLNLQFRDWAEAERITQDQLRMLDLEARIFLEVAGGCERIRSTLLPPSLTWVTRIAVAGFLLALPWFLRDEIGWLIIPVAGLASFLVLVSETIAHALERPFGTELNQLKLSLISDGIEASTGEILQIAPH